MIEHIMSKFSTQPPESPYTDAVAKPNLASAADLTVIKLAMARRSGSWCRVAETGRMLDEFHAGRRPLIDQIIYSATLLIVHRGFSAKYFVVATMAKSGSG